MTKFGKIVVWTGLIIIILVVSGIYYSKYLNLQKIGQTATSYEDCVAKGNPSLTSYPPQCIDKAGNHFTKTVATTTASSTDTTDTIKLFTPTSGATITSPVILKGQARGSWFFEASFPVNIVDWDGKIIGQGSAQANGDWMTEDFVPFTATITFKTASTSPSKNGSIILKKDNPSDEPENDASIEIPIYLK